MNRRWVYYLRSIAINSNQRRLSQRESLLSLYTPPPRRFVVRTVLSHDLELQLCRVSLLLGDSRSAVAEDKSLLRANKPPAAQMLRGRLCPPAQAGRKRADGRSGDESGSASTAESSDAIPIGKRALLLGALPDQHGRNGSSISTLCPCTHASVHLAVYPSHSVSPFPPSLLRVLVMASYSNNMDEKKTPQISEYPVSSGPEATMSPSELREAAEDAEMKLEAGQQGQPQSPNLDDPHWRPGFANRFPWLGFGALVVVLLCAMASVLTLELSNGKSQTQWPSAIAPNVILNIFNNITNICFGIAISQCPSSVTSRDPILTTV
nr:hypothetical protein CFP56_00545 [Quercus suber]